MSALKYSFVIFSFINFSCLYATTATTSPQDMIKWAHNLNAQQQQAIKKYQEQAHQIISNTVDGSTELKTCRAQKIDLNSRNSSTCNKTTDSLINSNTNTNRYPNLMIFVSFSMARETLKHLAYQAHQVGGKLIFRGLVDDSFIKTAHAFKELGIEALIDPTLFKTFNIQKVPAFIVCQTHLLEQQAHVPHDILYGNVSLHYALQQFATRGELKISHQLLKSLKAIS